jgi:hypothetical protein
MRLAEQVTARVVATAGGMAVLWVGVAEAEAPADVTVLVSVEADGGKRERDLGADPRPEVVPLRLLGVDSGYVEEPVDHASRRIRPPPDERML